MIVYVFVVLSLVCFITNSSSYSLALKIFGYMGSLEATLTGKDGCWGIGGKMGDGGGALCHSLGILLMHLYV